MRRALLASLGALALAGCDYIAVDSGSGTVVIGFVGDVSGIIVIQAPNTARAGTAFDVTVNTVGSSSCVTPVRADVVVQGLVARITPYDRIASAGPCTADLAARPHAARVTFPTPGTGTLEAHARTTGTDGVVRDTVVRRTITIR